MPTDAPVVLLIAKAQPVRVRMRDRLPGGVRTVEARTLADLPPDVPRSQVDLVISDVRATDRRALALYHRIEADPELPVTPIILLVPEAPSEEPTRAVAKASPPAASSVGLEKLEALVRHHLALKTKPSSRTPAGQLSLRERIDRVVNSHLEFTDFTVRDLADIVGLSRRHLTRRMKEAMGTTPAALIRERRLERAEHLLGQDPDTILQVAQSVGFRSASAFSKAFRRHTGATPSEYVRQSNG